MSALCGSVVRVCVYLKGRQFQPWEARFQYEGEISILNLDGDQHKRLYFRTNDDVRERRGETRHPKEHSVWKPCASVGPAHATERLEWQDSD